MILKQHYSRFFEKKGLLFFLFFVLVSTFIIYKPGDERSNFLLQNLYFISSTISLFGMFSNLDKLSYSVNKIFFIFHFLFFGIAPIVQYKNNITFFGASYLNDTVYLELAVILILVQLIYLFSYCFFIKKMKTIYFLNKIEFDLIKVDFRMSMAILSFFLLFFFYLIDFNWIVIIERPGYQWQKNNTNLGLLGYALLLTIRSIPIVVFLFYKLKNETSEVYKEIILLLFVFIIAFPTSLPRATVAAYYLPLFFIYVKKINNPYFFNITFLLGFFLLFPILNYFKEFNIADIDIGVKIFKTVHLDAFHNFAQLYSQQIITNGRQFIGSIFFFIPESIWYNRPKGTGHMLAEINNYSYSNISMPLWGEGFVNFGFYGILVCIILISFINAFFDSFSKNKNIIIKILFLFFIGYEFYLLRGDLFSSCKKIFGFSLAILIVFLCYKLILSFVKLLKI